METEMTTKTMCGPKCRCQKCYEMHGSGPMVTNKMTTDTPRTDADIMREAKILKLTKQNYHGLAKSKTAWYATMAKTRDIYEEGEAPQTDASKPKLTRESYDENWNMTTDTPRTDAWECFSDPSYYDMARLRHTDGPKDFNTGYHLNNLREAVEVRDILNELERRAEKAESEVERLKEKLTTISLNPTIQK